MSTKFNLLALLLAVCTLSCTSTNTISTPKEASNTIIGKWYVSKIESSDNEQEELEFNAFMEFLDNGSFSALLDDDIRGTYEVTKKKVAISSEDFTINFEIQSISETDLVLVTRQETGDFHLYMSRYSMMNKPSTAAEPTLSITEYPKGIIGKWNIIKTFLSDGDTEEFEENAFIEFFEGGRFNSLLDDEIEGTYAIFNKAFVISSEDVTLSVEIIYLSATHFNFIIHPEEKGDDSYYFFTSKYTIDDKRSIFK